MINSISFSNFKGQTGVQKLTGRDIIIGPNGSGKSTRVQALGLAMQGYVPGEGKTEAETMKMATGDQMSVGLQKDIFVCERRFAKTIKEDSKTGEKAVKVTQSILISPGRGETTDTQKKQRIADEIGNFPVMLDFNEFLSLTDTKRREFFYNLSAISADEWAKETVEDHLIVGLITDELILNKPEQAKMMQSIIDEALQHYPDGWPVSDGIQAMIDWTTEQLKLWKTEQKDAQGAVRQIAEIKNSLEETDRGIAEARTELEKLQQALIEIEKQIAQNSERKRIGDQQSVRIEELQRQINALTMEEIPAEWFDLSSFDRKIEDARAQLVTADYSEEIATLTKEAGAAAQAAMEAGERADAIKEQIIQINAGLAGLEKSLETINGLGGHCIADARIGCEKDFSKFREFVEQKRSEASVAAKNLKKAFDAAVAERDEYQSLETAAKEQIEDLVAKERDANVKNRAINDLISALERKRNDAATAEERRANQISMLTEELTRLQNEPIVGFADLSDLEGKAGEIRDRITSLNRSVEEKTKARQTLIIMQQSVLKNQTAAMKAVCLKALSDALGPKGIQGELVKEILDPIRTDIGSYLETMGFDFEPYFQMESETGKEIFQFGWVNDRGHRVNFDALSTGQQTIFLVAMMLVIINRANPKTKVLVIDNLNHLDETNFQLLLDGLSHVTEVDNILLAGAISYPFTAPNGWTVTDLGLSYDYLVKEGDPNELQSA